MHLVAFDVGAQLDAGDEDEAGVLLGGPPRLGDALGGVVVGEGEDAHAVRGREVDELGRRQAAVGGGAVVVEVCVSHRAGGPRLVLSASSNVCSRSTRSMLVAQPVSSSMSTRTLFMMTFAGFSSTGRRVGMRGEEEPVRGRDLEAEDAVAGAASCRRR